DVINDVARLSANAVNTVARRSSAAIAPRRTSADIPAPVVNDTEPSRRSIRALEQTMRDRATLANQRVGTLSGNDGQQLLQSLFKGQAQQPVASSAFAEQ